jgi:TolA-binding protein
MSRLLTVALAVAFLTLPVGTLASAPPPDQEMHNLKRGHKQQWRSLKEQQRAEKDALALHPQTREQRKRFKQDMKAQRRLVRHVQKTEIRGLKESRRSAKRLGRASKHRERRVAPAALNLRGTAPTEGPRIVT